MDRFILWTVLLTVILLTSTPLSAEPLVTDSLVGGGVFSDVIDVDLAGLEVYVRDRHGQPLRGLDADDFEVRANGSLVEISDFFAVEQGQKASGVPMATMDSLFLVVFIDNIHLSAFGRNRLLAQLRPFLESRMKGGDQVMLVTDNGRVDTRRPFTRDWREIRRGLEELGNDPGYGHVREREHSRVIENIRNLSELHAGLPMENLRTRCPKELESMAGAYAGEVYSRVQATVQRLGDFVDTLGNLPGRKALLHVSDGLHLLPGGEVYEHLRQLCGDLVNSLPRDMVTSTGPTPLTFDGSTARMDGLASEGSRIFRRLAERANAQEVTFYTFEAHGPRDPSRAESSMGPGSTSQAVERSRIHSLRGSLKSLAERTGGRAILDTVEFGTALARIGEDFGTYYSLGYSPPQSKRGGNLAVQIVVRRRDARVRYRQTLRPRPLSQRLADHTRATLMYGVSDNPLAIRLEIGTAEVLDKSLNMVPIRVQVPLDKVTLLAEAGESRGRLSLFLAARDHHGRMAPVRSVDIPIRISAAERARDQPFLYVARILMRRGDHSVAVGVHDELGRQASYLVRDIQVIGQ